MATTRSSTALHGLRRTREPNKANDEEILADIASALAVPDLPENLQREIDAAGREVRRLRREGRGRKGV